MIGEQRLPGHAVPRVLDPARSVSSAVALAVLVARCVAGL